MKFLPIKQQQLNPEWNNYLHLPYRASLLVDSNVIPENIVQQIPQATKHMIMSQCRGFELSYAGVYSMTVVISGL